MLQKAQTGASLCLQKLYEKGGELDAQDVSRRKPCIKNLLDEPMEKVAFEFAIDKPAYRQRIHFFWGYVSPKDFEESWNEDYVLIV